MANTMNAALTVTEAYGASAGFKPACFKMVGNQESSINQAIQLKK